MMANNRLLQVLGVLIITDILITAIAVGYMGAIELNPLLGLCGFGWAMLIKIIISVGSMYILYRCAPRLPGIARPLFALLIVVYGVANISNMYQLTKVFI